MVAPSRPPSATTTSAPTAYAPMASRGRSTASATIGTPATSRPTIPSSTAWSGCQASWFHRQTCSNIAPSGRCVATAATIVATTALSTNGATPRRCVSRRYAKSAIAGNASVGFAQIASARSAPARAGRRESMASTAATVSASATRSGFMAGPHTATGAAASDAADDDDGQDRDRTIDDGGRDRVGLRETESFGEDVHHGDLDEPESGRGERDGGEERDGDGDEYDARLRQDQTERCQDEQQADRLAPPYQHREGARER